MTGNPEWWFNFEREETRRMEQRERTNEYKGTMPDEWFKQLTPEMEAKFRKWTRENYTPRKPENFSTYHPVVRDEWKKIDEGK